MRGHHKPNMTLTCQTDRSDEYIPLQAPSSQGSGSDSCPSPRYPPSHKHYHSSSRAGCGVTLRSTRASFSRYNYMRSKNHSSSEPFPFHLKTTARGPPSPDLADSSPPKYSSSPTVTVTTTNITTNLHPKSDPIARFAPAPDPAPATKLSDIQAVTFLFLWWRATDAASSHPILADAHAGPTWARCCEEADNNNNNNNNQMDANNMRAHPWMLPGPGPQAPDPRWVSVVCHRARIIDAWTQAFVDGHVEAGRACQVLHVGCGLDARHLRVRWAGAGTGTGGRTAAAAAAAAVRWVDVDLPAVTELRRRVMPPAPVGADYLLRTLDITVEGWFRDIPADRPTLFICENLLYYLAPSTVQTLLSSLVTYFLPQSHHPEDHHHCNNNENNKQQLIFDTCGTLLKKYRAANLKNTTLKTKWTLDDAHDVEAFHPALRLSGRVRWEEYLGIDAAASGPGETSATTNNNNANANANAGGAPLCYGRPPLFGPWTQAVAALRHNRLFKEAMQVVRYDFGGGDNISTTSPTTTTPTTTTVSGAASVSSSLSSAGGSDDGARISHNNSDSGSGIEPHS